MEDNDLNAYEFIVQGALRLAVRVQQTLDAEENLTPEQLQQLSNTLLNVTEILFVNDSGECCDHYEDGEEEENQG